MQNLFGLVTLDSEISNKETSHVTSIEYHHGDHESWNAGMWNGTRNRNKSQEIRSRKYCLTIDQCVRFWPYSISYQVSEF